MYLHYILAVRNEPLAYTKRDMTMDLLPLIQWLEATEGSVAIRESILLYPIIETTHVLTLCLFFGLIAVTIRQGLSFLTPASMHRAPAITKIHGVLEMLLAGAQQLINGLPVRRTQLVIAIVEFAHCTKLRHCNPVLLRPILRLSLGSPKI